MQVPLLALTRRSLREDTRAWVPHLLRMAFLLVMFLVIAIFQDESRLRASTGLNMLITVLYLDLACITLVGIGGFCSVIAEEKEQQSLGLLKLTAMSPLSILLGKSMGPLLNCALILAIQVPFSFLAMALGGVSAIHIINGYMLVISVTLFIYALALACSVVCHRTMAASVLMTAVLILMHLLPLFILLLALLFTEYGWLTMAMRAQWMEWAWWFVNLLAAVDLYQLLLVGGGGGEIHLSASMIAHLLAAAGLFLFSWLIFVPATEREPTGSRRRRLFHRKAANRTPRGRAWADAVLWKEFRFFSGGMRGMILITLLLAAILGVIYTIMGYVNGQGTLRFRGIPLNAWGYPATWVAIIVGVLQLAAISSRFLVSEVRGQTLSTLALTPRGLASIVYGKLAGATMQLIPTILLFTVSTWCYIREWNDILDVLFGDGAIVVPMLFIFGAHLATLLSLLVHRGALAISVGTCILGAVGVGMLVEVSRMQYDDFTAMMNILAFFLLAASLAIHPLVGARLRVLLERD